MKDTKNITIITLTVTAVILLAMVIGSRMDSNTAYAGSASVKGGDYIMVAGGLSSSADLLYVVDIATRKLNVYFANSKTAGNRSIDMLDSIDMDKAFSAND